MIANYLPTATGKVRAVCYHCDRTSAPTEPGHDGQPRIWNMARGWSAAPYAATVVHNDGSTGTLWTCPACRRLRDQRQRDGIRPLLTPSDARVAARHDWLRQWRPASPSSPNRWVRRDVSTPE